MSRRDVSAKGLACSPNLNEALLLMPQSHVRQRAFWRVLVSADHKSVGTLFILMAFIGGCVGGVLSMLVGQQLIGSTHGFITSGNVWNAVITAHGLVMIFWFVMPALIGGMGNWFVPLMIGAADTAFPRLNVLTFWLLALGFVCVLLGLLWHSTQAPDFSLVALSLAGASALLGAANFIVTILNMRASGLGLHKMPLFCWSILVASFLLLLAVPVLAGAVTILAETKVGGFLPLQVGPALFSRLFGFFGHPEAYIIMLPAIGVISQILVTFAGRAVFAYLAAAYAMVAIGVIGFVTWAHWLFFPAAMTHYVHAVAWVVAVPSVVLFGALGGTLYQAKLNYKTPLLWALGFMFLFAMGGLMGMVMALTGGHNTYSLVAHLHYVLSMGAAFSIFGGFYYWVGKIAGRPYPEFWGKVHFWTFFVGVNLTFFPMQFSDYHGWGAISFVGALLSGVSALVFFYVIFRVFVSGRRLPGNYWGEGATSLEWTVPSPAPLGTFKDLPSIR